MKRSGSPKCSVCDPMPEKRTPRSFARPSPFKGSSACGSKRRLVRAARCGDAGAVATSACRPCVRQRRCLPAATLGPRAPQCSGRGVASAGAHTRFHGRRVALSRPRPRQAHRGDADRRGPRVVARTPGPRRVERAPLRARLARPRRPGLGQRIGPTQGGREFQSGRTAAILALHGGGRAAALAVRPLERRSSSRRDLSRPPARAASDFATRTPRSRRAAPIRR